MSKKKTTDDRVIQTELFPSEESSQSFDLRNEAKIRIKEQNAIAKLLNSAYLKKLVAHHKQEIELSFGELKQASDALRNNVTWLKQALESQESLDRMVEDALTANSGNLLNIAGLSDAELDNFLKSYEQTIKTKKN